MKIRTFSSPHPIDMEPPDSLASEKRPVFAARNKFHQPCSPVAKTMLCKVPSSRQVFEPHTLLVR